MSLQDVWGMVVISLPLLLPLTCDWVLSLKSIILQGKRTRLVMIDMQVPQNTLDFNTASKTMQNKSTMQNSLNLKIVPSA